MQGLRHVQEIFESRQVGNTFKDFYLSDPILFPKRFTHESDIEIAAFIAAMFAIGPRYAIIRSLENIFSELGETPCAAVRNFDYVQLLKKLGDHVQFAYKNIGGKDVVQILFVLKNLLERHGAVENVMRKIAAQCEENNQCAYHILTGLLEELKSCKIPSKLGGQLTARASALLASPRQGSACKRMNMFLRWMTRKDEIDFGIYDWLGTDKLVIPLDVNVSRAARELRITERKTDNWRTAVEITESLKMLDPFDPVKYDVPLFLYGIELRRKVKSRE